MKAPVFSIEKVTPEMAWDWLKASPGNRSMKEDKIASYVTDMKRGKWYINNNSILFDANGNLIDGHHRLYAVVVSECTVEMGVIRGADPDSRDTIDSGAARELADHLRFAKMTNSPQRAGYLKACVRSVLGMPVPLNTMEAYAQWEPLFHQGTERFFEMGCNSPKLRFMRNAHVAGPLIVAYKINPEAMEQFWVQLRDGSNLKPNSPALKLREFLYEDLTAEGVRRASPDTVMQKVFACAKAYLEGRSLAKVQTSETATEFFRAPYARGTAGKLAEGARQMRNLARRMVNAIDINPLNDGMGDKKKMTLREFKTSLKNTVPPPPKKATPEE